MVMFYFTQTLLVNLSYVAVHFMLSYVVMFMSCLLGLLAQRLFQDVRVRTIACVIVCIRHVPETSTFSLFLLIVDFITHNCWLTCLFGQTMHGVIYCTQSDPGACYGGLRSLRRDAESLILG
jgi:hypothetical protein